MKVVRIFRDVPNEGQGGAGAGGGSGGRTGTDNGAGGQQQQQSQTPDPTNIDTYMEMWNPPKPAAPAGGGNQPAPPNPNPPNNTNDAVKEWFKGQDYSKGVDVNAMKTAFDNRDFQGVLDGIQNMMRGFHEQLFGNMDAIAKKHANDAQSAAVNKSQANYTMQMAENSLFSKHKEYEHGAVKPIALGLLKQGMAKGMPLDKAIENVDNYFKALGKKYNSPPPNGNNNRGGPGGMFAGGDEGGMEATDWSEVFGPAQ